MGDIADQIVEGMICQLCCCSDGREAQGYPYTCAECGGDVVEDDDPSIFDLPEKQQTNNTLTYKHERYRERQRHKDGEIVKERHREKDRERERERERERKKCLGVVSRNRL